MVEHALTSIGELFDVGPLELPASVRADALVHSGTKKRSRGRAPQVEDREQSLAQLHTRLYLYGAMASAFEVLPDDVRTELLRARLMCRLALTYFELRATDLVAALATLRAIADDELLDAADDETRAYVHSAVVRASILAGDANACTALNEIIETCNLGSLHDIDPRDLLALATARMSYNAGEAQATIHELRGLATKSGQIGSIANYLLTEIYGHLALPLEQLRAFDEWWLALTTLHNKHPATLAGSVARHNRPLEQALTRGARQYARLLRANGQDERVSDIAQQFRAAGYPALLDDPRGDQPRVAIECCLVDTSADRDTARRWVYEMLTRAGAEEGCLIARDASAPETFPGSIDIVNDAQFRRDIAAALTNSGVDVDEGVLPVPLDTRRWILFRTARPFESVAAGFLPIGKDTSVVFWRSAVFDATTLNGKGTEWFQSLSQAMRGQSDQQTITAIREAIRAAIDARRRSKRPKIIK